MSDNQTALEVRRILANAYTFIYSVEAAKHLREVSLNQLITESIAQLGEKELAGPPSRAANEKHVRFSRRDRLLRLKEDMGNKFEQIKALPPIVESDPELRPPDPEPPIREDWA